MNRNKGKITLSLAIAATLALTSATAFADTTNEAISLATEEIPQYDQEFEKIISDDNSKNIATEKQIESIKLNSEINEIRTLYMQDQPLQNNLKIEITYTDQNSELIDVTSDMFKINNNGDCSKQFDTTENGAHKVSIVYNNNILSTTRIVVQDAIYSIDSLEIKLDNPEILQNSNFEPKGKLIIQYDSSVDNYKVEYPLSSEKFYIDTRNVNTAVPGKYEITCSLGHSLGQRTAKANVRVISLENNASPTSFELKKNSPNKLYYTKGDLLEDYTVLVTYSDGSISEEIISKENIVGFDSSNLGEIELTLNYKDLSHKLKVEIVDGPVTCNISEDTVFNFSYNNFGSPTITEVYPSGKEKELILQKDDFIDLNLDLAGTQDVKLIYNNSVKSVKANVSRPLKEIKTIKQTSTPYVIIDASENKLPNITYKIEYIDGTSAYALLNSFDIEYMEKWNTHTKGVLKFIPSTKNFSLPESLIVVTDDPNKIGAEAILTLNATKFKKDYRVGESPDDAAQIVVYDHGVEVDRVLSINKAINLQDFDTTTTGTKTARMNYMNMFPISFNYNVTESEKLHPIKIIGFKDLPTDEYVQGSKFDGKGSIEVEMSDYTKIIIPLKELTPLEFESDIIGKNKEAFFNYQGLRINYIYNILSEQGIKRINISGQTSKYKTGESFDGKGQLEVTYNDGTTKIISLSDVLVTGFDTSSPSKKRTIKISKGDITFSYKYSVVDKVFENFDLNFSGYFNHTIPVGSPISVPIKFPDNTKGTLPLSEFNILKSNTDLNNIWNPETIYLTLEKNGKTAKGRIYKELDLSTIESIKQSTVFYSYLESHSLYVIPYSKFTIILNNGRALEVDNYTLPSNIEIEPFKASEGKKLEDYLNVVQTTTLKAGDKTIPFQFVLSKNVEDNIYNGPSSNSKISTIVISEQTVDYKVGDKFDGKGKLTIKFENGNDLTENLTDLKINGFDTSSSGKKNVTVNYEDQTITFEINVADNTSGGSSSSGSSSGGSSSSGSSSGGDGATTPAKPAETKPATPIQTETKSAIKDTTQVGQGEIKVTKFDKITAENIKQVNAFVVPTKLAEGITLPNGMKTISVEGNKPAFTDVARHWAASSINEAVERGLLNGMSETSFSPKAPLTMEQTLVGLNNVLLHNNIIQMKIEKKDVEVKLASQLENPTWSTFAVAQVLGNTDKATLDKVAANPATLKSTMTRGEMANVIYSLAKDVFPNNAKNPEEFCKELGIMVGDKNGNFASERVLSRAELSSILLRIDDKLAQL